MTSHRKSDTTPRRALLVGYGNPYRHDDGAALFIINAIRGGFDQPPLAPDDTGEDQLGARVDSVHPTGLTPDMALLLSHYELVLFIDTNEGALGEPVHIAPVVEEQRLQSVTHHLSPGLLLRLARKLTGTAPKALLVSVQGYEFDFGDGLSPLCQTNARTAIERIRQALD